MIKSTSSKIGLTVERLRKARELSQEKLARLADVSNNTLINIESGRNKNPTIETLRKIADALSVKIDQLIE